MEKECIFCKIISGDIPSFKIFEDDNYLAFLDRSQFTKGHTLVVPKKHYSFVWDVIEIDDYISIVQKISNNFRRKGFKYVDSLIFGRDVHHAHIHLLPHNGDLNDYNKALNIFGAMSSDNSRWPTNEIGNKIVSDYKYEE